MIHTEKQQEFSHTCEQYASWFLGLAQRNLPIRVRRDAEDVVQDAFLSAWENLDAFRGEGTMRAWIGAMIVRIAWARARQPEPILVDSIELFADTPPDCVEEEIHNRRVLVEIDSALSEKQKLFLADWKDGKFSGRMGAHENNNMLRRTKDRMRTIAIRKRLIA